VLCTNGHVCANDVQFCPTCGINTFHPSSEAISVGVAPGVPTSTNGLAIASLVLGILWVWWIGSVLALIFGLIARKQIKQRPQGGAGMAIAGIVLGAVGVVSLVAVIVGVSVFSFGGLSRVQAIAACEADGFVINTAIAAYDAQGIGVPSEARLVPDYVARWPSNPSHYQFLIDAAGNLWEAKAGVALPNGSAPFAAPEVSASVGWNQWLGSSTCSFATVS